MDTLNIIASILSGLVLIIATAIFKYAWNTNIALNELKNKVDILYKFWEKEVFDAIAILHKPHPEAAKLDSLLDNLRIMLEKFDSHTLKDNELVDLILILETVKGDNARPAGERLAASRVLNYIESRTKPI